MVSSLALEIGALLFLRTSDLTRLSPAESLLVSLIPFGFWIWGMALGLRKLHQRPVRSLVCPTGPFRWGALALSAGAWLALSVLSDGIIAFIQPGNYRFVYEPGSFWPYLIVAVLLLPVQAAAEELFFRGYLTQGFGRVWGPLAAWWIPGVLFGLLHGFNPEIGAYGLALTLPVYIGMGLILGWVTIRTGGLEAALGMHLANNLYGTLLVTAPVSALPAPALFRIQTYDAAVSLIAFLGSALLYVAFMNFILRRKSDAV